MTERWWSVHVEAGVAPTREEILEDFLLVLPDAGGSSPALSWGDGEVSVWFSVSAPGVGQAVTLGLRAFTIATGKLGIDVHEVFRAEAVTDERLDQEIEQEPERYVGVSEIAAMLDVSKQRVSELRTRPDFPAPVAELAAGPVWRASSLRRFMNEWPRRPGRPQSWDQLNQLLAEFNQLIDQKRILLEELLLSEGDRQTIEYLTAIRNVGAHASMHDLAQVLGVSDEAVRSRIRRARSKLEDLIDEVEEPAPAGARHERS